MKRIVLLALASLCLLSVFLLPSLYAQFPPAEIRYPAPQEMQDRLGGVIFSHDTHYGFDCTACHHTWDGMAEDMGGKCSSSGCHGKSEGISKKLDSTYNAYHNINSKRSCKGCHMAQKKAGEPYGPIGCSNCHSD